MKGYCNNVILRWWNGGMVENQRIGIRMMKGTSFSFTPTTNFIIFRHSMSSKMRNL
jgi:hypothetical protein